MPQGMTKAMQFCACADRSTLDFDHDARCKPIVNWRWKREKIGKKAVQNRQNVEQVCGFPVQGVSTLNWQLPHCDIWSVTLSDAGRLRISSPAIIRRQELTMLVKNSELKRIMIRSTNILITITNIEACYSTWRLAMVPGRPTAGRSREPMSSRLHFNARTLCCPMLTTLQLLCVHVHLSRKTRKESPGKGKRRPDWAFTITMVLTLSQRQFLTIEIAVPVYRSCLTVPVNSRGLRCVCQSISILVRKGAFSG